MKAQKNGMSGEHFFTVTPKSIGRAEPY